MLQKIFEENVRRYPDRPAVKTAERCLTYRELDCTANRAAHTMIQMFNAIPAASAEDREQPIQGNAPYQARGAVVGLLFEHGADMIIGLMSAVKAGYVYVPLDPNYPEQRLRYMTEHAGVRLILTNTANYSLAGRLSGSGKPETEILNLTQLPREASAAPVERLPLTKETAYILYTSGSTGVPKGVVQSYENIWHFIRNYIRDYHITSADRLTLFSAFSHDAAVMDIYSGLLSGAALYPLNLKDPAHLAGLVQWLQSEEITVYHSVPTVYRHFTGMLTGEEQFPHLRWIVLGGEEVLRHDVMTFTRLFAGHTTLVNLYGQSESSYNAAQCFHRGRQVEKITLGHPVEDCEIWVVNGENEETADFETGEIIVACEHIALGYWRDAERTQQVFIDSPAAGRLYRTGDLGRRLMDGTVEFVGRKDFQVKIRGYRVDLSEIENRLLEHPAIDQAAVLARDNPNGDKWLCAYVVTNTETGEARIKAYLREYLPDYMIPPFFVYLDCLPVTPTNKIDRNALPEPVPGSVTEDFTAPANQTEAAVRQIWATVLRMDAEKISVNTSFFDLGGNSLSVMNLATLLSRAYGKNVRIPDLFRHTTVEKTARFLEEMAERDVTRAELCRVPEAEWYPVSSAQQRMYILHQLEGNRSTAYHLPTVLHMEKPFDLSRFRAAFERLTERHESLRTSFHLPEGKLVQKVHPQVELPLERFTLPATAPRNEAEALIADFIRPFDLEQAPLFRIGLICWGEEQILVFDIHHIISDGTSNDILLTEFLRLYTGESLPPLGMQYRDFAVWQRRVLESEAGMAQEAFWLGRLAPEQTGRELPVLNLPVDYPRPAQQSFAGARFDFTIHTDLTGQVRQLASSRDATLFMVLLAVYNLLLAQFNGQEDIIIGSPVAGRPEPELNQVLGMFVNTLALRSFPEGMKSFSQYLWEIREVVLQALEFQDYPFELLVSKLKLKRDTGRNPLFDASFRLQNFQRNAMAVNDIVLKPFTYHHPVSQFDLQLTCREVGSELHCDFVYASRLFTEETVRELARYFTQLLQGAVTSPDRLLHELRVVSGPERRLLDEWNATATDYPREMTIHRLFELQTERTPAHIALNAADRTSAGESRTDYTYAALNERANRLARCLRARGVGRETVVALMTERSAELIIGMLAVMKAGGVYLPMDPQYPAERIQYILHDSGAALLLTTSSLRGIIPAVAERMNLDDPGLYTEDGSNLSSVNSASDLIYLIYTSGSTGQPKGTMLEHCGVHNFITGMRQAIDFAPGRVIGSLTTAAFDIFVLESLLPLTVGMKVVLATEAEQRDPGRFYRLMAEEEVDMIQLTPSRLQMLLDDSEASPALARMKSILVGGEAFPKPLLDRVRQVSGARIYNMYGPTETTVWSGVAELTDAVSVTIGHPIANTRFYILNPYREWVPARVTGELYIAGEGVARGYFQQPERTRERFIPDPWVPGERMYRTGDLARRLPDGKIEFLGRTDDQVKIRGYRIEVGEIEAHLRRYPGIRETVVVAREGGDGFQYLAAYYTAGEEIAVTGLRQALLRSLPDYMVPGVFMRIDALPLTPNGKIDRKALPDAAGQRPCLGTVYQAAETELQKKMAEIWSDLLKIGTIGVHDNFFDLGGNSLLLVQLRQKIETHWPGQVAVADLFAYPTVATLTAYMEAKTKEGIHAEEAARYWQEELGEEWELTSLPGLYNVSEGETGRNTLRLRTDRSIRNRLEQMAHNLQVDLIAVTTGMFIFLLREFGGSEQIIIEAALPGDPKRIFPIKTDLRGITDLTELFRRIHQKYGEAQAMFHAPLAARLRKQLRKPQILPLFTAHAGTGRNDNDLILVQQYDHDGLTWICEYDQGRLNDAGVEEFLDRYGRLLEMLAQEYEAQDESNRPGM